MSAELVEPPPLPRVEADLEPWHVFTDWLLEHHDWRGELLAAELALPSLPAPEELARFQALAKKRLRERRLTPVAWCLSHARTIDLVGQPQLLGGPASLDGGAAANLTDYLSTPNARRVERLAIELGARDLGAPPWRRLMRALPPWCTALALSFGLRDAPTAAQAASLVASLPPQVRALTLRGVPDPTPFLDDALDLVDAPQLRPDGAALARLAEALARTARVRLRLGGALAIPVGLGPVGARLSIGAPGEAGLLSRAARAALALPRPSLLYQQRRHGIVPVRTQLARVLPEAWSLDLRDGVPVAYDGAFNTFIERAADGRFTVGGWGGATVAVDGVPCSLRRRDPLGPERRISLAGAEWTLVPDDLAAASRALFDAAP